MPSINTTELNRVTMTLKVLSTAFERHIINGVRVAIEEGGVTRWVHDFHLELGANEVHAVNPNRVRLIAESSKKKVKVDAKLLAGLHCLGGLPEKVQIPSVLGRGMRMLIKV